MWVGVHYDLGDLKQTMTRGKKFSVTFIDDYSRFTRVYLFRNKDEAFDMFLSYKVEVENQLDRKIKRIRSDRGGECIPLNDYCEKAKLILRTLYFCVFPHFVLVLLF